MIVRIPTRAILPKEREKETDFIIIGENQITTDFSVEEAGGALAYILTKNLSNGVYIALFETLKRLSNASTYKEHEKIMNQLKTYAEKFEVK